MKKNYFTYLSILLFIGYNSFLSAQIGGRYVFEFLNNPHSARLTALGGSQITVADEDISLATSNPALLNEKSNNQFSFNHNFHFADINNGHIAFGKSLKYLGGIHSHIAVSYVSFGDFVAADELGNDIGVFSGNETAVTIGASKQLNERISLGVNLKGIFGNLESFSSSGIGVDVGLLYIRPESNIKIGMVVKNIGTQFTSYGTEIGVLPLDVQIGISNRLKYLPFRFTIIAHQLQRWGIRFDDPNLLSTESILGEPLPETSSLEAGLDNFFRHFIFNGEFLLGKQEGLKLRFGYNHLRRQELSLSNFRSLAGFNLGFGIRIKGVYLDYGIGYFHIAGATNHLSIRTSLDKVLSKF